jgi:hypothetical protein
VNTKRQQFEAATRAMTHKHVEYSAYLRVIERTLTGIAGCIPTDNLLDSCTAAHRFGTAWFRRAYERTYQTR